MNDEKISQSNHSLQRLPLHEVEKIVFDQFGMICSADFLDGESDFNYHLISEDQSEFTLKVSRVDADHSGFDFQVALLNHLEGQNLALDLPYIVKNTNGDTYFSILDKNKAKRWFRLHKWVPGRMLAEANPRSDSIFKSWGKTCGLLSKALSGFDHPSAHRFYNWDPSETLYSKQYRSFIQGQKRLEIADYFWSLFEEQAKNSLPKLRKSINYNDAHEHNLILNDDLTYPEISGIIDFGDALYTHTINELAITCAYACMDRMDPLETLRDVVSAYHEVFPITEDEAEVLFPMIGARLMITVVNAARNRSLEPDNEYLFISETSAWNVLERWRSISPDLIHMHIRHACGWEPCPLHSLFQEWIITNQDRFIPPLVLENKKISAVDLSVGSLELGNNANFKDYAHFNRTIRALLDEKHADIAIGGYGEYRPFYTAEAFKENRNKRSQWRTMHLGVDIWTEAGTEIVAPLDACVHSIANNRGKGNYGGTVILRHELSEKLTIYSLYGHIDLCSLEGLQVGQQLNMGQGFCRIGKAPENGDWPPHLHFQIILDLFDTKCDYIGACFPAEASIWKSICPDPSVFFSQTTKSEAVLDSTTVLKRRRRHLGKSLSISYKKPLHIVRGFMQHLYDATGQPFLDTVNNVAHVGHEHPDVVRAAQRQIGVLNTNTRYLHDEIIHFAEELLSTFPPELSVVHFVNSGSEANELALRMVRTYTGQKDMIAVEVGYHGNTGGCIDISSYKFDGKGGKGAPPHTHVVPIPDIYRGLYTDAETAGEQYASHIESAIEDLKKEGRNIGGFICESILSCGGQIVLPENYLKTAFNIVRKNGGLCIADEVQVGFGRIGDHFWGYELQSVIPDIVTMGKPIGNGHPLAAVVTTAEIAEAFANGMEYFNTFGGNPVSCAIGREVLRIIREEELQLHAKNMGEYLSEQLKSLQSKYAVIGDVRGHGLFLGFELVQDRTSREPATNRANHLKNRMRERGILMSTDGPHENVLKIKPPMCFNKENADLLVELLDKTLGEDCFRI